MAGRETSQAQVAEASEEVGTPPEEIDPEHQRTQGQSAEYIAHMLQSLRGLARRQDLGFLSYLLGLALEEARQASNSRPAVRTGSEG